MSDGISALIQDERISQVSNKISKLEEDFLKTPSEGKAKEMIKLCENFMNMGFGYNTGPSKGYAMEKISLYGEWLSGETPLEELKRHLEEANSRRIANVATGYWGFANVHLENIILDEIQKDFDESLSGEKIFLKVEKGNNEIKIKYEKIPEGFFEKKKKRCENYTRYLKFGKD